MISGMLSTGISMTGRTDRALSQHHRRCSKAVGTTNFVDHLGSHIGAAEGCCGECHRLAGGWVIAHDGTRLMQTICLGLFIVQLEGEKWISHEHTTK